MGSPFQDVLSAVRRSPLLMGLSTLMVGLALFVLGLFALVANNLQVGLQSMEERVEVVAYLRDDALRDEVDGAIVSLRSIPDVEAVRHVTKAEALDRAVETLPEISEVSSDLEVNPFPASLEIRFRTGSQSSESVAEAVEAAELFPFVEDVTYGSDWVNRLFFLRRVGGITAFALGGAFALVAALIIAAAIRIAIFARKEEISIMHLVGAKDAFIRRPFLVEGAVTGLLGGLLALALTFLTYLAVHRFLFTVEWVPGFWVLGGLLAGTVFGLLASGLAVRRYLREI
jgi:cell division transport system permease protein